MPTRKLRPEGQHWAVVRDELNSFMRVGKWLYVPATVM